MDHLSVDSFSSYEAYALSVVGRYALHGGGCSCGSAACAAVQLVLCGATDVLSGAGLEQQGFMDSWAKRPVPCGVEWSSQFRSSRPCSFDRYGVGSGFHDVLGIEGVVAVDGCGGASKVVRGETCAEESEKSICHSAVSDRGGVDIVQSGDDLEKAEVLRNCLGSNSKVSVGVPEVDVSEKGPGVGVKKQKEVGPNGGISYGRKANYRRNQNARDQKKERKKKGLVGVTGSKTFPKEEREKEKKEKTDLQKSSESKWQAQNRLAAIKAEREIAILEATDLDEEKRKRRAQICAATERNLVSIEKFHNDLRKSGNTSSDDDTRVNTIFSAGAGSISPSSSISEADVRKAKKDMEDAIAGMEDAIARENKEKGEKAKLAAALIRLGHNPEAIIGYGTAEVDIDAKTEWTVDSKDCITSDNEAILDIVYPDGYLVIHDDIDYVHPDGKRKVRLVGGERYSVAAPVVDEIDYDAKSHWSLGSRNAIPDEMAAKLFEKFPNGYKENYDSYSDAVTGKPRGVIRPTALPPRVL